MTLARYEGGRVGEYQLVGIFGYPVSTYRPPRTERRLPTLHTGVGAMFAEPVSGRTRLTTLPLDDLVVIDHEKEWGPQGLSNRVAWPPPDLSAFMRPEETLAGPRGVPESADPPDARAELAPTMTTVFAVRDNTLVPTAVVRGDGGAIADRIDIPALDAKTEWAFLAPLTHDSIAVLRRNAGGTSTDLIQTKVGNKQRVLHRLPLDAQVLTPGAAVR